MLKVTSLPIDEAPPMIRPIIKSRTEASTKQKPGWLAKDNGTSQYVKKN